MDELIAFLRSKTQMGRFTEPEIRDLIARMDEDGWEIVRKDDGAIVEPEPQPDPLPPESAFAPSEANDKAREWLALNTATKWNEPHIVGIEGSES